MPEWIEAIDPRTGECDHRMPQTEPEDLELLARMLRRRQPSWAASGSRRAVAFRTWAARLRTDDELLEALVRDTGRLRESVLERDLTVAALERWAGHLDDESPVPARSSRSVPSVRIESQTSAYPLVGVISPWNFPLLLSMIDTLPALAAGCAVLAKPSEVTPRFIEPLRRSVQAVDGLSEVLAFVVGGPELGEALIDRVDAVCFTGSTATGRRVARQCAERLICAFLELGGKDPALVLQGANLERTARAIAWGGCVNAGQSCLSIERVYAEHPVYDDFVERLCEVVKKLRLAHPTVNDGLIGPIIAPRQVDVVRAHLADARERGARALVGGNLRQLGGGWYCEPTVLVDVRDDMLVMREESFAPILPVVRVADEADAIERANDSPYGLGAAVFGDPGRARAVARCLQAGAISIGDAALTAVVHDAPKQAFKASGLGPSRMGRASMDRFLRQRAVLEHDRAEDDPWWFEV